MKLRHVAQMDQKVTTQDILGELDERGVTFLTLRMRSKSLQRQISALQPADYKTITIDRPGKHNRPRVHENPPSGSPPTRAPCAS